jgi:hypothetical protein
MTCDQVQSRLDDFVDGTLPADEVEAVQEHVTGCVGCSGELNGLLELGRRTAELPAFLEPPRDLWPWVAAEIERRKVVTVRFGRPLRIAAMAVAAAAVLVAAVLIGYMAGRQGGEPTVVRVQPTADIQRASLGHDTLNGARNEFDEARAELLAALDQRRGNLSPQTLRVVESNLRLIDQAIEEITSALEQDPGNSQLAHRLTAAYRQQIELLRRATRLPAEI